MGQNSGTVSGIGVCTCTAPVIHSVKDLKRISDNGMGLYAQGMSHKPCSAIVMFELRTP